MKITRKDRPPKEPKTIKNLPTGQWAVLKERECCGHSPWVYVGLEDGKYLAFYPNESMPSVKIRDNPLDVEVIWIDPPEIMVDIPHQ